MSAECKLDQPVPLSYYSSVPVGAQIYQPQTMRDLIELKTKDYVGAKQNATVENVKQFASNFSMDLYKIYDGSEVKAKADPLNEKAKDFLNTISTELKVEEQQEAEETAEEVLAELTPKPATYIAGSSNKSYGINRDGTVDKRTKAYRDTVKEEEKEAAEKLDRRATSLLDTISESQARSAAATAQKPEEEDEKDMGFQELADTDPYY